MANERALNGFWLEEENIVVKFNTIEQHKFINTIILISISQEVYVRVCKGSNRVNIYSSIIQKWFFDTKLGNKFLPCRHI